MWGSTSRELQELVAFQLLCEDSFIPWLRCSSAAQPSPSGITWRCTEGWICWLCILTHQPLDKEESYLNKSELYTSSQTHMQICTLHNKLLSADETSHMLPRLLHTASNLNLSRGIFELGSIWKHFLANLSSWKGTVLWHRLIVSIKTPACSLSSNCRKKCLFLEQLPPQLHAQQTGRSYWRAQPSNDNNTKASWWTLSAGIMHPWWTYAKLIKAWTLPGSICSVTEAA